MCRIQVHNSIKSKVFANDEQNSELKEYKYLLEDAKGKHTGNTHDGYSVMIFGTRTTQKVREGDLIKKFFIDFEKIKMKMELMWDGN